MTDSHTARTDRTAGRSRGRGGSNRQPLLSTLWKYCGVSLTQTFVELGAFSLLQLAVPAAAANTAAIVCSAAYQFLMNRNLTFKASGNFWRSVALFVLMWLWNYAFSTFALATAPSTLGWSPIVVKLATMGCQGVWGFLLSRYVIFR